MWMAHGTEHGADLLCALQDGNELQEAEAETYDVSRPSIVQSHSLLTDELQEPEPQASYAAPAAAAAAAASYAAPAPAAPASAGNVQTWSVTVSGMA